MASSPVFVATVPNGSAETAERMRALLSATCTDVSVQQVRGSYELRYRRPGSRACLRSESTVLRKALKTAAWEGLPRQFKGDWLRQQREAETTASGEASAAESAASSTEQPEPPDPAVQREAPSLEALPADLPGETHDQQPEAEQVVFVDDFRADLARLLNKKPEQLGRIRRVEGIPAKYSLVDVVVAITGKTPQHANHALDEVVERDGDVCQEIARIPLLDSTGLRRQRTRVADIQTVLRVIVQLPCRGLGPLKREICEVFARFMGGDLSLIPELQANHARQQALLEEGSQSPEAAFGEYVRATRPPPPQEIWRTPAPQGVGDYDSKHYVLGGLTYPDMCKTGRTIKRMDERLKEINSRQTRDLGLYVVLVYHYEGPLEQRVRSKLDAWGCRQPPAEYGVNGCEFRIVSVDAVQAAVEQVKKECATEAPEPAHDTEALSLRRRRERVEVEELEVQCAAKRLKLDKEVFELEQAKQREHLELQKGALKLQLEFQRGQLELQRGVQELQERALQLQKEELDLELRRRQLGA